MSLLGPQDEAVSQLLREAGIKTSFQPSPNTNQRPDGAPIDTLVIHYTALDMAASVAHLTNPDMGVSTHYVIDRDGTLVQLVPLARRAWHAGVSELYGRPDTNSTSVGIDLVFIPELHDGYTEVQYKVLALLLRALVVTLPIAAGHIVGHEHVALPAGRKADPGPLFDWSRCYRECGRGEPPSWLLND